MPDLKLRPSIFYAFARYFLSGFDAISWLPTLRRWVQGDGVGAVRPRLIPRRYAKNCVPASRCGFDTTGSLRALAPPLSQAPKIQGRVGEVYRLLMRASGLSDYPSDQASRWLMRTMARECHCSTVTAVHAYEDCSLWQFIEAKRLGKACRYAHVRTVSNVFRLVLSQMSPALHDIRLKQAFYSGKYDDEKRSALLSFLRPGGAALDVGANIHVA